MQKTCSDFPSYCISNTNSLTKFYKKILLYDEVMSFWGFTVLVVNGQEYTKIVKLQLLKLSGYGHRMLPFYAACAELWIHKLRRNFLQLDTHVFGWFYLNPLHRIEKLISYPFIVRSLQCILDPVENGQGPISLAL